MLTAAPALTEAELKAAFVRAVKAIPGIEVIRQQSGTRSGGRMRLAKPGTPDFQILLPRGRSLFLELKTATGKLNPEQVEWHERATALGHRVATIHGDLQRALDVVARERYNALNGY